jgi:hypothetical protein
MSLRIFHIIFVVVCVLLALFVAVWGFRNYLVMHNSNGLILGLVFLASGVALVVYGVKVFDKLKELP